MKKTLVVLMVLVLLTSTVLFAEGVKEQKPYIAVVSKGEQHDFWQQVKLGANAAAADYGVDITFEGPPSESDVQIQVEMLNNAMAKNPVAIALAALNTSSVLDQLQQTKKIKVFLLLDLTQAFRKLQRAQSGQMHPPTTMPQQAWLPRRCLK